MREYVMAVGLLLIGAITMALIGVPYQIAAWAFIILTGFMLVTD